MGSKPNSEDQKSDWNFEKCMALRILKERQCVDYQIQIHATETKICCSGKTGYALAPLIARGQMLGQLTPIILHLLDVPSAESALKGVEMELNDGAFHLLHGMYYFS